MQDLTIFLDQFHDLEEDSQRLIWEVSSPEERELIKTSNWEAPEYILEGRKLLRRRKEKNKKLSGKAKIQAAKRRRKKSRVLKKAKSVLRRMQRLKAKSKGRNKPEIEDEELYENFSSFVESSRENQDDSRGPQKLLILSKNGSDGRKALQKLSEIIYKDLGFSTWVEEGPYGANWGEGEEPRDYGLFVSLRSYSSDDMSKIKKKLESLVKSAD